MALPPLVSSSPARFRQFTHFTYPSPRRPSSRPAKSIAEGRLDPGDNLMVARWSEPCLVAANRNPQPARGHWIVEWNSAGRGVDKAYGQAKECFDALPQRLISGPPTDVQRAMST